MSLNIYLVQKYPTQTLDFLLITSNRNPSDVVQAKLSLYCEYIEIEDKKYVLFDFRADYLNGKGFTSIY